MNSLNYGGVLIYAHHQNFVLTISFMSITIAPMIDPTATFQVHTSLY